MGNVVVDPSMLVDDFEQVTRLVRDSPVVINFSPMTDRDLAYHQVVAVATTVADTVDQLAGLHLYSGLPSGHAWSTPMPLYERYIRPTFEVIPMVVKHGIRVVIYSDDEPEKIIMTLYPVSDDYAQSIIDGDRTLRYKHS